MRVPGTVRLSLGLGFGGDGRLRRYSPSALLVAGVNGAWRQDAQGSHPVEDLIKALEQELARHPGIAVGFFAYEWAGKLTPEVAVPRGEPLLPLAWWAFLPECGEEDPAGAWEPRGTVGSSLDPDTYCRLVEEIRLAIGAGEVYQVNLTRRWQAGLQGDPAGLFFSLTQGEPPQFAMYLEDTWQGWSLLCLSPELFLRRQGEVLESWPIKGTWWGDGVVPEAGEKETAELAMIVDLVRNDLGRICEPGCVQVEHPSRLVQTRDVVHREAVVRGLLREGTGLGEILQATFPGGSVTGAPKLAACELIARLEPVPRGPYCGACGVLGSSGDFTLAMPIRTGYARDGQLFFHSGGGIVWDSQAEHEEEESRAKIGSWLAVLGGQS